MATRTIAIVRYGVGSAERYTEADPYIGNIKTPEEAVAEYHEMRSNYPEAKLRIFKRERVDVVTDMTDQLV